MFLITLNLIVTTNYEKLKL